MQEIIGPLIFAIIVGCSTFVACNFVSNVAIEKMHKASIVCKEFDKTVVCTENGKVIHSFSSK